MQDPGSRSAAVGCVLSSQQSQIFAAQGDNGVYTRLIQDVDDPAGLFLKGLPVTGPVRFDPTVRLVFRQHPEINPGLLQYLGQPAGTRGMAPVLAGSRPGVKQHLSVITGEYFDIQSLRPLTRSQNGLPGGKAITLQVVAADLLEQIG